MKVHVAALLFASVSVAAQPADVAGAIKRLALPSVVERVMAVQSLLDMGAAAAPAIPALLDVLKMDDGLEELTTSYTPERVFAFNPVQNIAVRVLANIGPAAIAPIEAALKSADPAGPQLSYMAEALARMQRPEATAIVDGLVHDPRADVRRQAADVLGYSKDPSSVDVLIAALSDSDPAVRSTAAESLQAITGQTLGVDAARWTAWRAAR